MDGGLACSSDRWPYNGGWKQQQDCFSIIPALISCMGAGKLRPCKEVTMKDWLLSLTHIHNWSIYQLLPLKRRRRRRKRTQPPHLLLVTWLNEWMNAWVSGVNGVTGWLACWLTVLTSMGNDGCMKRAGPRGLWLWMIIHMGWHNNGSPLM